ncbi:MAG TPA: cell wall-binding repeat-containing protein [Solirubrobacteraceae bacterium]|nr:cell wall-binding repeat-containing protein [Solirubrobacteraceae bacterium]
MRPPAHALAPLLPALIAGSLLAGCGKTSVVVIHSGSLNPVAPVAPAGAAGQITKNTTRLGGTTQIADAAAIASAVHPGLVASQRPAAALLINSAELPLALAAAVLAGPPLHAPILYGTGAEVPAETETALSAMRPTGTGVPEGAQLLEAGGAATPRGYRARSLPGSSEEEVAEQIAKLLEGLRGHAPAALLIVNVEAAPAFALPAAGLAAAFSAPILFARREAIPPATRAYLAQLKSAPTLYLIGPRSVLGEGLAHKLSRYGHVRRIAGETPAEEAIAVARFSEGSFGFGVQEPGHGLIFVNAQRPLDAPAAAALSASGDFGPILLLEGQSALPAPLSGYLEDIRGAYSAQVPPVRSLYNHGWIIGGADSISVAVQDEIDALLEITERQSATPSPAYVP